MDKQPTTSKLSEFILEKIQHEKIKPIPRWQFIALSVAINLLLIFTVILGSLAIGILLRDIFVTDWAMMANPKFQTFEVFSKLIPYIWIIFLVFSVWFAKYVYSRTRKAYKHKPSRIVLALTLISLVLGVAHYQLGSAHRFDRFLREGIPPYDQMRMGRDAAFNSPEEGLLSGMIKEISEESLILEGPQKETTWTVTFTTDVVENVHLKEGYLANIVGEKIGENTFAAVEIRLLGCPSCDHEQEPFAEPSSESLKEKSQPARIN